MLVGVRKWLSREVEVTGLQGIERLTTLKHDTGPGLKGAAADGRSMQAPYPFDAFSKCIAVLGRFRAVTSAEALYQLKCTTQAKAGPAGRRCALQNYLIEKETSREVPATCTYPSSFTAREPQSAGGWQYRRNSIRKGFVKLLCGEHCCSPPLRDCRNLQPVPLLHLKHLQPTKKAGQL